MIGSDAAAQAGRGLRRLAGEGLRMALLSLASLALGYALTLLLSYVAGLPAEQAFGIAVVLCSVVNFFGCRHYVFRGAKGPLWQEALRFFPSVFLFRAMEVALFAFLNRKTGNPHLAYFGTAGLSLLAKLVVSRLFIFRRQA